MSLAETTLSSACAATDNFVALASATSIAAGRILQVDGEVMQVSKAWTSGTTVPVLRGLQGTAVVAHVSSARVVHGDAEDFGRPGVGLSVLYPPAGRGRLVSSVTATSSLSLSPAGSDHVVTLNGTSVITLTIPVPTKDKDGDRLTIMANGAAAHILTFTGGLGGASTSYDVVTENGNAPVAFEAIACNEVWLPIVAVPLAGTVTNITATVT